MRKKNKLFVIGIVLVILMVFLISGIYSSMKANIKSVKWETCEEMEYPTSDELKYVTADVSFTPTQNDLELLGVDSAAEYPVFVNSRDKKNIILSMVNLHDDQSQIAYKNIQYGISTDFHYKLGDWL